MKCEQAESLMAELLAGDIRPDERSALDAHLLECASCRGDFETARVAQVAWPDVAVPQDAVAATLEAVGSAPPVVRFLRAATAAAAVLALALLVTLSIRGHRPAAPIAKPAARAPFLASMQEAGVGTLVAKDEQGRPVGELGLKWHRVEVEIRDGVARTTVEENFENHTGSRLEGTFRFPLPPDASISRLALEVNGKIEEGTCLERERAREVFERIVRKMQDPALLEWMPGGMFQCRVFPIEPRSTKRVIVAYTQALPYFKGRMTYVYPLVSEKTRAHPPAELRIDVRAQFSGRLEGVESPSHRVDLQRPDAGRFSLSMEARAARPEQDFVVTMDLAEEEHRLLAHRPEGEDGYFALFLTPRMDVLRRPQLTTFVLDVSASVSGPELDVAKKLVRAMMERAIPGDRFQLLAHAVDVESSGEVDLRGAMDFLDRLRPIGACDLLKALRAAPAEGEVVYIGEGTPTFGETDPAKILEAMRGRRIRTVGVGSDANTSLLEKLGGHFRVSPSDLVDRKVAEIAETFGCAAVSEVRVEGGDAVYDVAGARDFFVGQRLVVTGRYRDPSARLVVTARGYRREIEASFPDREDANNYVRRLWAQRKVADLLAAGGKKEEVTALGVKHQIMTPYTSFLVLESEQMWKDFNLKREVQKQDELSKLQGKDGKSRLEAGEVSKRVPEPVVVVAPPRTVEPPVLPNPAGKITRLPFGLGQETGPAFERFTLDSGGGAQPTDLPRNPATSPYDPNRAPTSIFRVTTDVTVPGAPITDAAPVVSETPLLWTDPSGNEWAGYLGDLKQQESFDQLWGFEGVAGGEFNHMRLGAPSRAGEIREALEHLRELKRRELPITANTMSLELLDLEQATNPSFAVEGNAAKAERVKVVQGQLDQANSLANRVQADQEVFVRQLEVQLGQIQELTQTVDEHRGKLARALSEKSMAAADLAYSRQVAERLQQDLGQLEEKYFEMAKDKRHLEEKIQHLSEIGTKTDIAPRKQLDGKITAVVPEIGLVVISIGKDAGVQDGDEFTIYRGTEFVAKIVIDRADGKWAAGRIVLKKMEVKVGDDVSNHIFVGGVRQAGNR